MNTFYFFSRSVKSHYFFQLIFPLSFKIFFNIRFLVKLFNQRDFTFSLVTSILIDNLEDVESLILEILLCKQVWWRLVFDRSVIWGLVYFVVAVNHSVLLFQLSVYIISKVDFKILCHYWKLFFYLRFIFVLIMNLYVAAG